jgi:hypothetical protein
VEPKLFFWAKPAIFLTFLQPIVLCTNHHIVSTTGDALIYVFCHGAYEGFSFVMIFYVFFLHQTLDSPIRELARIPLWLCSQDIWFGFIWQLQHQL